MFTPVALDERTQYPIPPTVEGQLLRVNASHSQADLRQVPAALHQYCGDPPTSLEDLSLLRSGSLAGNWWLPGLLWPCAQFCGLLHPELENESV